MQQRTPLRRWYVADVNEGAAPEITHAAASGATSFAQPGAMRSPRQRVVMMRGMVSVLNFPMLWSIFGMLHSIFCVLHSQGHLHLHAIPFVVSSRYGAQEISTLGCGPI